MKVAGDMNFAPLSDQQKISEGVNVLSGSEVQTNCFLYSDEVPRKNSGLFTITNSLKTFKPNGCDTDLTSETAEEEEYCETGVSADNVDTNSQLPTGKPPSASTPAVRKRRMDRATPNTNGLIVTPTTVTTSASAMVLDYAIQNNNNNNVKHERLSPGTPDTSSRSRSVTPSSASHPDTPPAPDTNPLLAANTRNYSDIMRSLAAKYNNANPNDYFSSARNGFPPPLDPRFKPAPGFPGFIPTLPIPNSKDPDLNAKKPSELPVLNPFASTPMFPPFIDMSSTQALIAMVRTAKEAEFQNLLKHIKRPEASSPLDLSAAGPPNKRPRTKTISANSPGGTTTLNRAKSESPIMHEDISHWSVDDVCNFISGIDICAEYAQTFRSQQIDGAGLPLLTEEHLTAKMNMKLGPALKLRSILAKKLGSCSVCLHCSHCHNNLTPSSPDNANNTGNSSDSGGTS